MTEQQREQQREYIQLFRKLFSQQGEFRAEEARLLKMWEGLDEDQRLGLAAPDVLHAPVEAAPS